MGEEWKNFINNFNARITQGKRRKKVPDQQGLKLLENSTKDEAVYLALQIYSELGKQHEYYIKIQWDSKENKYIVGKNLLPYGVIIQKLLQDRTLKTFENVADLIKEVFECCSAFHNRQKQIQDMKVLMKMNHWHMEVFFSYTLLYVRIGFYPLDDNNESPSKERKHVYIELHYEQHQTRPNKVTLDCTGYPNEDMEDLNLQFSVFKKYTLDAALEFALVKMEEQEELEDLEENKDGSVSPKKELVSASEHESFPESAVAAPSGTQQQRPKSPSASSYSSS
ncbi:uncharacterized protein [Anabrus simplex]|uniref:uncharacterized protein isoform X2 n=1 Tax=Anabrus simplex TaxID=316456 RepID=UPI0035A30946